MTFRRSPTLPGAPQILRRPGSDLLTREAADAADAAGRGPVPSAMTSGGVDHDAAIDTEAREAVATLLDGGGGRVSVTVREARVALEGTVPSASLRDAIGDAVARCSGVVEVDNRLEVAATDDPQVLSPERRTVTHSKRPSAPPSSTPASTPTGHNEDDPE